MALNPEWVDAIFARLTLAYGVRFIAQYGAMQPEHVKAAWADTLDGVSSRGVRHAYDHLDPDYPPNALQFRKLCREAYTPARPELPAPKVQATPADLQRLAAAAQCIGKPKDPKAWAQRLREREESGESLSIAQRAMWRASCMRIADHGASVDEGASGAVKGAVSRAET